MKCPQCQFENPEDFQFCGKCGYDMRISADIRYNRLSYLKPYTPRFLFEEILINRSVIEGERKQVTVFFTDVVGFTSFSEKLDPEQVHQIMDGAFRIMMDEIHEYEGTINQFTGDGVMALFGAPVASEDHPDRACQVALKIQKAMLEYNAKVKRNLGVNFKIRAGLNTGLAVVGSIGDDLRMDYTAVGDTVNLASRMQSIARPGTILVSQNTYKRVKKKFIFTFMGRVKVKGKESPLAVYKLIDTIKKSKSGLDRQIFSEMVGREKDLKRLQFQVLKAINGEGSVVNIVGEAGIGKSRLIAELKNCALVDKVILLEGRAISIGRNLSFHPVIDLLKQWARIIEDDSEAAALSKLETAIRKVYPEKMQEVLPFIATLMGMKLSGRYEERIKGIEGEALEKLILKNVRELLIKTTEVRPLVIVIEDLQWADMSSIKLMESTLRLAETQRILFINVFRPGHKETSERIVATVKEKLPVNYVEIVLLPLDEMMSETLIKNMLNIKGLQLSIIDQIVERAGGNPFYIEEVVRSFIDEGAVVLKDGVFEMSEKINSMLIPYTINDVIMARIDRLEKQTRNLVKLASVIGRSFFYRILSEVAKDNKDLDNKLLYLKKIQLIQDRRRMGELEYFFKHALVQETVYESILVQKRKELHLNVACAIEKVFKEKLHEFYGMLAFHYSKGKEIEKTEKYLIKSGEKALRTSASAEALNYFKAALELYQSMYWKNTDCEKVVMIKKNIALAFYARGDYSDAVEYFDKILEYYGEKLPQCSILITFKFFTCFLNFLISIFFPLSKWKKDPSPMHSEFLNLYFHKIEALTQVDSKRFFIESFSFFRRLSVFDLKKLKNGVGVVGMFTTSFSWTGLSFLLSKKLLKFIEGKVDVNDAKSVLYYENYAVIHNVMSGNWDKIKEFNEDLVNQNLGTGEIFCASCYLIFHGVMYMEKGHYSAARKIVDKLSEIADVYENDTAKSFKYDLNRLLMKYRKLPEALVEFDEAISFVKKKNIKIYAYYFHACKARVQIMLEDMDGAEESLKYAKECQFQIKGDLPHYQGRLLSSQFIFDVCRLEASVKAGDKLKIVKYSKKALKSGKKAVRNSKKVAYYCTDVLKVMGTFYWLISKQKKAIRYWDKSIKKGEKLGAKLELSRTYMEVGRRLREPQSQYRCLNGISAERYLEKGKNMIEEMNIQWDLDELDRINSDNSSIKTLKAANAAIASHYQPPDFLS